MQPMFLARMAIVSLATAQKQTPFRRSPAPETSFRVVIWSLSQAWHGIRAPALAALSTKMPGVAVVLNPWACPE
jgi:hypothetical protein